MINAYFLNVYEGNSLYVALRVNGKTAATVATKRDTRYAMRLRKIVRKFDGATSVECNSDQFPEDAFDADIPFMRIPDTSSVRQFYHLLKGLENTNAR